MTSRAFRARLAEHGIAHRRGGYRDPYEAREKIGAYVNGYHHRPHSRLAYRTPREVAATWKDPDDQSIPTA